MFEHHTLFGLLALVTSLLAVGYSSWQIYTGQLKPHAFTILIWFVVTAVAFFNLMDQGAGPAAWRTGFMSLMFLLMFLLSVRHGFEYVTKFDILSLTAALCAVPIWLVMKNPDAALLWVMGVELVGVLPTLRKAFSMPYEMSPFIYGFTSLAMIFQLLSLDKYTPVLVAYFTVFPVLFLLISIVLVVRRRLAGGAPHAVQDTPVTP